MSAVIVGRSHIDVLVSAALDLGLVRAVSQDTDALGRMLMRENLRSVVHRYRLAGGEEAAGYEAEAEVYRFTRYRPIPAVVAAKAAACYAYQACECEDWRATPACRFIEALQEAILRSLPGYEAVPWGFDTSEQAQAWTGVRLPEGAL